MYTYKSRTNYQKKDINKQDIILKNWKFRVFWWKKYLKSLVLSEVIKGWNATAEDINNSCTDHETFWTLNINYTKTKQASTTKLGRKKTKSNIYLVWKNKHKNQRDNKVINIWNIPTEARNLENPGLGISQEPKGCSSTDTCFDTSVQRSFVSESLKSVALIVTEINKLKILIFKESKYILTLWLYYVFFEKMIFKVQPCRNIVNLYIFGN